MPPPDYYRFDEPKVVVLGCKTCGLAVVPEFRRDHTQWHKDQDELDARLKATEESK